ncbi:hypothetical protein FRC02_010676 [Tulasnella sp. 418]|nr:hypothetical protein FRC02_010676 [Tulasnella sp. 418]
MPTQPSNWSLWGIWGSSTRPLLNSVGSVFNISYKKLLSDEGQLSWFNITAGCGNSAGGISNLVFANQRAVGRIRSKITTWDISAAQYIITPFVSAMNQNGGQSTLRLGSPTRR